MRRRGGPRVVGEDDLREATRMEEHFLDGQPPRQFSRASSCGPMSLAAISGLEARPWTRPAPVYKTTLGTPAINYVTKLASKAPTGIITAESS